MTTKIDFYYDLVSPNTYMANQVLPDMAERLGVEVNYIPILLGAVMKATNNTPPFVLFANVKGKNEYGMKEIERFVKKHKLSKYKMNSHFPLNSLLMMRGAIAAEMDGRLVEYLKAGEALIWEEGLKTDDPEVFVSGFTSKGFDGQALLEKAQDPAVKQKLIENTEEAVGRGVFGVPAMFVGDELFWGKDRLRELEDEIVEQQERASS